MVPSPTHIDNGPQTPTCAEDLRRRRPETAPSGNNGWLQDSGFQFSVFGDPVVGER
jgi:hypothetical protein